MRFKTAGFTLIEMLVAMLVFALVSVLGYQAVNSVLEVQQRNHTQLQAQLQLQRCWSIMLGDLMHLRPRPVRDALGGVERALQVPAAEYAMVFTRGGLPPLQAMPGGLQRVAYSVDEQHRLLRWHWPVLDRAEEGEPSSQVLLEDVAELQIEALDGQHYFTPNWPPLDQPNLAAEQLPLMLQLTLVMRDGRQLQRLLPGVQP